MYLFKAIIDLLEHCLYIVLSGHVASQVCVALHVGMSLCTYGCDSWQRLFSVVLFCCVCTVVSFHLLKIKIKTGTHRHTHTHTHRQWLPTGLLKNIKTHFQYKDLQVAGRPHPHTHTPTGRLQTGSGRETDREAETRTGEGENRGGIQREKRDRGRAKVREITGHRLGENDVSEQQ